MKKILKVYCDGGSRGNPGPAASGVVIMDQDGTILGRYCKYLGITTNNVAEYSAVVLAFEKLSKFDCGQITFYLDSELVVKQLNGIYKIKNAGLLPIYNQIILAKKPYDVRFVHVVRELNKLADEQVNLCLDQVK